MYFSESKATAWNTEFTCASFAFHDLLPEAPEQQIFTSNSAVQTYSNFWANSDNDESAPIRFTFEDSSEVEMQFNTLEAKVPRSASVAVSSYPKKTQVFLPLEKHQEFWLEDPVENVSPITPESPKGTIETKSSASKDCDSTVETKPHTSNPFIVSSESHELDNIFQIVASSKTDLNKYVEDLIFESNPEWEQILEHKVEVTKKNKKRMRKSAFQVKILEQELNLNPTWGKDEIREVCNKSGLEHSQVYKWYWDQQRKAGSKSACL